MRELMWTEESEDHIGKHLVEPPEVEEVVHARPRYVARGRGGTELVFGTTAAGRHLLVVLSDAADGRSYVVTARDMTGAERRAFSARGR